jgi:hypothetical protein
MPALLRSVDSTTFHGSGRAARKDDRLARQPKIKTGSCSLRVAVFGNRLENTFQKTHLKFHPFQPFQNLWVAIGRDYFTKGDEVCKPDPSPPVGQEASRSAPERKFVRVYKDFYAPPAHILDFFCGLLRIFQPRLVIYRQKFLVGHNLPAREITLLLVPWYSYHLGRTTHISSQCSLP